MYLSVAFAIAAGVDNLQCSAVKLNLKESSEELRQYLRRLVRNRKTIPSPSFGLLITDSHLFGELVEIARSVKNNSFLKRLDQYQKRMEQDDSVKLRETKLPIEETKSENTEFKEPARKRASSKSKHKRRATILRIQLAQFPPDRVAGASVLGTDAHIRQIDGPAYIAPTPVRRLKGVTRAENELSAQNDKASDFGPSFI